MSYICFDQNSNISREDYGILQQLVEFHAVQQKIKLDNLLSLFPKSNRCMARIHDNTQCTRKYKDNVTRLCGSHNNSLPYGRIDGPNGQQMTEKKSKGRKTKHKSLFTLDNVDFGQYIKTEITNIDGNDYLIDENSILYENNDTNMIVGRKLVDNSIEWF